MTVIKPSKRKKIMEQAGYKCCYCGLTDRNLLTIEHLTPVSRNGGSKYGNLGVSCCRCNSQKGNMTHEEYLNWLDYVDYLRNYVSSEHMLEHVAGIIQMFKEHGHGIRCEMDGESNLPLGKTVSTMKMVLNERGYTKYENRQSLEG